MEVMNKMCMVAACVMSASVLSALTPGDYASSLEVSLAPSSVPASEVTDFPALLRLSTGISGFSYDDFRQPRGSDLAIVDGAGQELAYEIDTWIRPASRWSGSGCRG